MKSFCRKEMAGTSERIEVEKFNGSNFKLWKLKMEDMLINRDIWEAISDVKFAAMSQDDWDFKYHKAKGIVRLCLVDSILLNVHEEKIVKDLWKKLGDVYQAKSLVNKLFLQKKLYSLRMEDGGFVADHMNALYMLVV